ncbi:hypothetical protein DP196_23985 [Enterobacter hormaechei subsp. steigerwaltii]|uniref:hypothetical protein n=1 Tax=Enterobacter hormaechei TaxID=158836 RepID=UPI000DCBF378|nr:hypothetical protein [Enterobacter hormaechei]RAY86361.1 hypothetical protein DP196_23985 [Enterobacter hormaechei subsp. steigerwaltii]
MSVKRYECGMTNAPTEYQSPTMHQDANGGYVSYDDYAALEARCAALAAEVYDLKHPGTYLPSKCETPALYAFLAEVRASAIDHAAAERWGSGYVFNELNELTAQIRKGVQS